ncbi:MAG: hypothetical protein IKW74_04355 [Thermoguttaceae bacterium]|nr:hypothetical protein [Thermoguttaceae bacterium]
MFNEDIPKCTRICCRTKRPFQPGESFYSILTEENGEIKRQDFSSEAWLEEKRDDSCLGWWKTQLEPGIEKKLKLAPNDILMDIFDELIDQPDKMEISYILTLLMVRRRIFRFEKEEQEDENQAKILVYSPRRETTYSIPVVKLSDEQIKDVQEYLAALIYSRE